MAEATASEIRFGGPGTALPPHAAGKGRASSPTAEPEPSAGATPGDMPWWRIMEQAFLQLTDDPKYRELYGDPQRGATLAQAWRTAQLLGQPPRVCLVVGDRSDVDTTGITKLVRVSRSDIVRLVCAVLDYQARSAAQLFTFDGSIGHSVTALSADPGAAGITFHDPWPGDSLLSAAQNSASLAAQRVDRGWHLTAAELERVLVAAFVGPAVWDGVTGGPGLVDMQDLWSSDFASFFHVREVARDDSDPTYVEVTLQPGQFTEHIDMTVVHYENGQICSAKLRLRESWVIGPPWGLNPLAKDIAASWLGTFVPPADAPRLTPRVVDLRALRLDEATQRKMQDPVWSAGEAGRFIGAYAGVTQEPFFAAYDMTALRVSTVQDDERAPWTELSLTMG